MESKPFTIGDLVRIKDSSLDGEPIFIWELIEQNDQVEFLVNSESGMSREDIARKFPNEKILLPNYAKFRLIKRETLNASYVRSPETGYSLISDLINWAKDSRNHAPDFFINAAYGGMHFFHLLKFSDSEYCKNIEERISNDSYSLIKKIPTIDDPLKRSEQNGYNLSYLHTLDLIPKRFIILKIITKAKGIVRENFPPENDLFSNSIIEKLLLGMFLSYYKNNRDKVKSITINYSQKFPGDFKVFHQFASMLSKFDEEINMYEGINEEQIKIELSAASSGVRLPKRDEGKGIIMKLLEFDLAFWQRLILLDIDKDVPVRKPYKESFSVSYNYMLLLPFFQWLAPHLFPKYEDKQVNAETYNKVVVERMKNFVEGKIF